MNVLRQTYLALILSLGWAATCNATPQNTLNAQDFLGAEWMQGPYHRVAPQTINNGQINQYIIETNHGQFTIDGTDQARAFIQEMNAVETLKEKSVVGAAGNAVRRRVVSLIETPIEVVEGVGNRIDTVDSVEDAVLLLPRTGIDIGGQLLNGAGEMVYTGNRIVRKAGGSVSGGAKCDGFLNCLSEAGEDVFSGFNSVVGKHSTARRIHAKLGTDKHTRNPYLKKEVDRLSYVESYANTAIRFLAPPTSIDELETYRSVVGNYNGGELVSNYKDAFKPRNEQRDRLIARGVDAELLAKFKDNDNYTKSERLALLGSLETFGPQINLKALIKDAVNADSYYSAQSFVEQYAHLATINAERGIANFEGMAMPVAMTADGSYIVTLKADYLDLSAESEVLLAEVAQKPNSELHILGHTSDDFKSRAQDQRIRVLEIR